MILRNSVESHRQWLIDRLHTYGITEADDGQSLHRVSLDELELLWTRVEEGRA